MLFDLSEGVLDDVDVTDVHVHQVLLLFVVVGPFLESQLQQSGWVQELTSGSRSGVNDGGSSDFGFSLLHLRVISLLELVLEILDLSFEVELLSLVLSFQSQDLIVGLLGDSLALVSGSVQVLGFVVGLVDLLVVTVVNSHLVLHFLSHHVDLLSKSSVLGLNSVEFDEGFVKLVLQSLDFMKILLSLGTLRSNSLFSVLLVSNTLVLVIVSPGVERSNLEGSGQLD